MGTWEEVPVEDGLPGGGQQTGTTEGGAREETEEGAREETGAGGARWSTRDQPGRRSKVESTAGGAMVKEGSTTPGGRQAETAPVGEEPKMEQHSRRARGTSRFRRA